MWLSLGDPDWLCRVTLGGSGWATVESLQQAPADVHQFALCSLQPSEWARAYYDRYRQRGHGHHAALRALGAKWLKIIFVLWSRQLPYRAETHLATLARQQLRQAA